MDSKEESKMGINKEEIEKRIEALDLIIKGTDYCKDINFPRRKSIILRGVLKEILEDKKLIKALGKKYKFGPVSCYFDFDDEYISLKFSIEDKEFDRFMSKKYYPDVSWRGVYDFYENCIAQHCHRYLYTNKDLQELIDNIGGGTYYDDLKNMIRVFEKHKGVLTEMFEMFKKMQMELIGDLYKQIWVE